MLMEDNQVGISICSNPGSHARTEHIDIKFHDVCEAVKDRTISDLVSYIEEMKFLPNL